MNSWQHKKRFYTDYLIVILSLFTVSPFINTVTNKYLLVLLVFTLFVSVNRKKRLFIRENLLVVVAFYVLLIIQSFLYNGFAYAMLYVPLITFYLPYLILQLVGISFFRYLVNVIYVIAIYTTPLWLLQSFVPAIDSLFRLAADFVLPYSFGSVPRSLLIYTAAWSDEIYNSSLGVFRNSGAFHEPGAYGVFLNLAIIINTFFTGTIFNRKNLVFMFCILTTLSTAGFITLFVILFFYLMKMKINWGIKVVAIVVFVFSSLIVYENQEFLQKKIQTQLEDQTYYAKNKLGRYDPHSGRFYAFFTSYELFKEHPFFGRGIMYATSEKASGEMHEGGSYTYGFMGILSNYGIFFGLFYMFNLYRGIKLLGSITKQQKVFIIGCFIALNLALLTQVFITTLVVFILFTLGSNYKFSTHLINYFNHARLAKHG